MKFDFQSMPRGEGEDSVGMRNGVSRREAGHERVGIDATWGGFFE
jgi:hypothetical protein